jgi:23S rRNA pseudouridine1911/1915/1917 synthase
VPPEEAWTLEAADAGERLDRHVAERLGQARHRVTRWIQEGRITLNGSTARPSARLAAGDRVLCALPQEPREPERTEPQEGPLTVLYEDDHLVAVDKPAGLAVHPGAGRPRDTLANYLLARYPELAGVGGPGRPGIVHRIDLDTTGILLIARSELAWRRLSEAFAERRVHKVYQALAYGTPTEPSGTVDAPIGRHRTDRKRMTVRPDGRPAITDYECTASAASVGHYRLRIHTGRTHQIRVHLKYLGHPLVGDPTYGEARWKGLPRGPRRLLETFPRPALHAWRLGIEHPEDSRPLLFEAPVPADLQELWRKLGGGPWPESPDSPDGGRQSSEESSL